MDGTDKLVLWLYRAGAAAAGAIIVLAASSANLLNLNALT